MERLEHRPTVKGPAERFAGDVWVEMIAQGAAPSRLTVGLVRFAPGSRTAWHRHAVGQTLHITAGTALVATKDGRTIVAHPGDTVHTPPGEWHWHGAAPESFMAHLAISEGSGDPNVLDVEWADHVSDEDYRRAATAR